MGRANGTGEIPIIESVPVTFDERARFTWPVLLAVVACAGAFYFVRVTAVEADERSKTNSAEIAGQAREIHSQDKRVTRVEDAQVALSDGHKEMKADIKEIKALLRELARR